MHTVNASPQPAGSEAVEHPLPVGGLIAALAHVEPALDLIQRAQGFEVVDPRFAALWEQLGRKATRIQTDIQLVLQSQAGGRFRKSG